MEFFRNLPIERKLMVIIMLVTGTALAAAGASFMIFEQTMARRQMVQALEITAAMTAANSTAGLSFDESGSVEQALQSLQAQPDIVQACVYGPSGQLFARYCRASSGTNSPAPAAQAPGYEFGRERLRLFQPIDLAGENIGAVYLEEDLSQLSARFWRYSLIGVVMLAACGALALVLSARLQKVISSPLSDLAGTVARVRAQKDYAVRAVKQGNDELGSLIDGFNEMLAEIQERDTHLERRVNERTEELAKSLSLLNATLESTTDGMLVVDRDRCLVSWNSRFVQMWQLPREKVQPGANQSVLADALALVKDPESLTARLRELENQPEAESFDLIELKDGRVFERYSKPQRLGTECVGRVWSFRDVTERKRIEQEIVESRNFLGRIINCISDPIFVKDREHRWVLVNDAACSFAGRSREDILGKTVREIFPKSEAEIFWDKDEQVFSSGQENINEETFTDAAGHRHTIITKKNVYVDEKGRLYIVGVIRDITDRQRAEQALRDSEARLKFIFESVPVGIALHLVHADGSVSREINEAHLRIAGLTREQHEIPDIYGRLIHPEDHARQQVLMQQVRAGLINHFTIDKRYVRLDGTTVWVSFSYQCKHYAHGGFEELTTLVDITESKRTEQALRESEASYYSLVDQMPAGIFRKDREGRYIFVNSWFCRFRGVKPADYLGKFPHEVAASLPPTPSVSESQAKELLEQGEKHHATIVQTGRQIERDERYNAPDGKVVYHHVVKSPVFGPDGTVVGSQGILLDVSEAKLAEEALAYERDLLRALLENSPDGIYFKDSQSRFIKVSDSQARQFGVASAEELIGKSDSDFFSPEHARPALEDEQAIIRTGQPLIGKVEKETWRDGREDSWVLTTKMPFRNKTGEIIGTFGISKNITALKRADATLAYERDLFEALLDQSPDSIFFKDRESRYVRLSRAEVKNLYQVALNRHAGESPAGHPVALPAHLTSVEQFQSYIIGKSDAEAYGPERARQFLADEMEIMRTGRPLAGKVEENPGTNGESTWFLTAKSPWRNRDGEIIGTFGTSRNITDLKRAEAQVEAAHRQLLETSRLAGMAEVATSVLHNVGNVLNSVNVSTTLVLERMKKSRLNSLGRVAALLEEQRDRLGEFFTKDPRGLQLPGYIGKLTEHLTAEQAELMAETELTRKNVEHIKDIVSMQQSYAKVSGVTEKVKVTDLVDDALRMNAGALARHGLELVRDYPAEAADCVIDRQKVLQILINLIRNAKYACDESGRQDKRLVMGVRVADGRVQITAVDNGVGIPPQNLTRIFNHGFTTRAHGHGFGLHSGALAARELGGSLTAFSDGPGTGARFILDLPLQPSQS